jgi:RNA polymerase sigma-70 factor, ECF subfamily
MTDALSAAFADEWGRVVATLVRVTGDWALAEDAAQDAFAAAAVVWPRDGVPRVPGAWLTTVARNRALDRLRRAGREARLLETLATEPGEEETVEPDDVPDDRLRLIFTCCHPALPLEARVALTLRTLCGLTVEEIAAAFGTGEAAMAKRLVRARTKIKVAGIPYRVPSGSLLEERLPGVLAVLYLLFTEGYAPSAGGEVVRPALSAEAIRLTRVLARLLPDAEVLGLLALELLQDSRRGARTDAEGRSVPLLEQDPTRWDRGAIAEAAAVLRLAEGDAVPAGPYRLQARIAAEHARGADADGEAVVTAYEALLAIAPSPHARLARAVAVGNARGTDAGLAAIAELREDGALADDPGPAAAEADLLRRAGRLAEAAAAYRAALEHASGDAVRAFLERRLQEVVASGGGGRLPPSPRGTEP